MTAPLRAAPRAVLLGTGGAAVMLGLVPLVGWLSHIPGLTRIGQSVPMAPNSAIGLIVNGLVLWAIATGRRRAALTGAVSSLLASGLTLAEYLFSVDLHIDQLWVRDYIGAYPSYPGRMSPNAAVCFLLCGAALLCASRSGVCANVAAVMGAVAIALSLASVAGHLTGIPMQAWGTLTQMPPNSALGLIALSLGILTWQCFGGDSGPPRRLALVVGSGGLTLSLCLGFAIHGLTPPGSRLPFVETAAAALISILLASTVELVFAGRQQAEALRSTYAELAVIHANAPVALLVVDERLQVEKVNALAARLAVPLQDRLIGQGPGAALGCLNSLADPKGCGHGPACGACPIRQTALDSLVNGVRHEGVEAWLPQPAAGTLRGFLVSTAAIQWDHTRKVLISAQDITARKQAERELQRQAELIDLSHDAIIETDTAGRILRWNTGAEELYGWTAREANGQTLPDLLQTRGAPPDSGDVYLSRDSRWEGELVHTRRDGRQVSVESRQILVRHETAGGGGILEINRDVTERKRAQEQLAAAHRRNTGILESISDGFNFLDREWRYVYVNPAAARLQHMSPAELLGRNLWDLWPHAADLPFGAAYRRAVAENVFVQVEAFYPERLNAWFEVRCYPSPDGLSLFFTDTTERKRAEERLQETVRALESALAEKTVLLKEVHHRVKNNLAVIASLLSMRAGASEDLAVRAALEDSRQRVYSIALIHEHLYGSDRLDRIDFAEYARQLMDQLYAAFLRRPERVSLTFRGDPVELAIHRAVPCGLILNELLSNAFKHAFPGDRAGTVSVIFRETGSGWVELAVEDDGVGLSAGWDRSLSLGWQIIPILARQLDGSVAVEPSAAGTRFVLRFPRSGRKPE